MISTSCEIQGLVVCVPKVFADERGSFFELWNQGRHQGAGAGGGYVQDNVSRSSRGTLRGLHFQSPRGQGKLACVLVGEVFDVAVDLRRGSPTFGRWHGEILSADNKRQIYVPPGFAHGYAALSESAVFFYKCTEYYSPADELTLVWDDPDVGIAWPVSRPLLSAKDRHGLRLRDIPLDRLFP